MKHPLSKKSRFGIVLRYAILLFYSQLALSQTGGTLDNTFDTLGYTFYNFPQVNAYSRTAAIQDDGKFILAGEYIAANAATIAVIRLTKDGLPDKSFGMNGQVLIPFTNVNVEATSTIVLQDGSIIIGGKSNNLPLLIKMDGNGSLINNFGTNGILSFDNGLTGVIDLLLDNGKIIGCGKSANQFCVFKRNADGTEDLSFAQAGYSCLDAGPQSVLTRMVIQTDGKILLTGSAINQSLKQDILVIRLKTDGSLDNSFNHVGSVLLGLGNASSEEIAHAIRVQKNGRIVVAGNFVDSSKTKFIAARMMADGTIDTSFNTTGSIIASFSATATKDELRDMIIQTDAKIILCGMNLTMGNGSNIGMMRLKTDGKLDPNFGGLGKISSKIGTRANGEVLMLQADNKIVVAGYASNNNLVRFMAARYNPGIIVATKETSKQDLKSQMAVWPNPVHGGDKIYIQADFNSSEEIIMKLSTLDGKTLKVYKTNAPQFVNQALEFELPLNLNPSNLLLQVYSKSLNASKLLFLE